jgi:dimethylaniline monooxygenase (N-oxide forming)
MLCSLMQARLGLQKDGLYLYRSILPPALPGLAFVGSEVSTLDNLLTAGLQAEWLAAHWGGEATLPDAGVMAEDVRRQMK